MFSTTSQQNGNSFNHHMSDCGLNGSSSATSWPFVSHSDPYAMNAMKLHNYDYLVMTALPPHSPTDHLSHHLSSQTSTSGVSQKDTTFTKIFVGGLPYHTTDKSLRQFFEAFGEIEEAVVITDRQTGKSRGYGFVTMADRESAERAVKEANPIIDGRKANVNLAYLGAKPRTNIQNGFPFPIRTGYPTVIPPGQYGIPPHHYVYHAATAPSAYIPAATSLLLPPTAALSPTHFYDYPPTAAYPPPPPYATATNGFDSAYAPFHPAAHSHQSGPIGPAAVAAAVAAAAANGGASTGSGHSAAAHHPFTAFSTLSGSGALTAATNGTVSTTGANYLTASVTPTTAVSYISDARMQ